MLRMITGQVKKGIRILSNPKEEFENLNSRSFESVVWDYAVLLLAAAIIAGAFSLIYALARAFYLDLSLNITIQYIRMINYSIGRSTSLIFLYLFAGTFLLFFLSMALKLFFRRIRYISLLKILIYSMTPLIFFSWFLPNPLPLGIWSLFLLAVGVKSHKPLEIKKDSIQKRD